MLWKIAFRNIRKHRRRTALSATTIAIGILFFIFMDSVMAGMDRGAIDNMISLSTAAIKIRTPEYAKDHKALPLKYGITDFQTIRERLAGNKRVTGVAPRTRFLGQLSIYTETMPIIGTVVDPWADTVVFSLHRHIEGTYFTPDGDREILLGKRLAEQLDLKVGDFVTLFGLTRFESRNADDFRIVGLLNTTDPSINQSAAFITYASANEFLDLEELVTEVNIGMVRRINLADFSADVVEVQQELKGAFPQWLHETFSEQAASFLEISKSKRAFSYIFLLIILMIASVGIFNTVLMSVYERIREIGVMRAYGFKRRDLTRLFLLEGFLTGVLGALLGVVLGALANTYLVVNGYPMDKIAGEAMSGLPMWGTIYGVWNFAAFAGVSAFSILVASVAGLVPARKAGRMPITQALRFD